MDQYGEKITLDTYNKNKYKKKNINENKIDNNLDKIADSCLVEDSDISQSQSQYQSHSLQKKDSILKRELMTFYKNKNYLLGVLSIDDNGIKTNGEKEFISE